jgi:hypothetical protein
MNDNNNGLRTFDNAETFPEEVPGEFEEKPDFQETTNTIPASLLSVYKLLNDEKKADFKEQLDNLQKKASNYRDLNGNHEVRMVCVKEIASIAKTFASKFALPHKPILEFASSFVTKIQQNEFKTLMVIEWLQLYIEADIEKDVENSRQQIQETLRDS